MAQYVIRQGNAPVDLFIGNGIVTNLGPGTIYYSDSQDVTAGTYEGSLAANASTSLEGVQWFTTDSPKASLYVVPGQTTIGQGPQGPPGPAGPAGPGGQDAVAISDAVRGQIDRFDRLVGGVLSYDGSGFVAASDTFSRPQNIDLVTTDNRKITVFHEDIGPRALIDSGASAGENLRAVGITAIARTASDLKSTDILLRQSRSLNDALTNAGNGTAWVKERGLTSPFTAIGLTNVSDDFPVLIAALANLAGYWRMSEPSGASINDETAGNHDGAVVGSGTTYSVTGLLGSDPDLAMTTTGVSTNELTIPITGTGITQAAFSAVWRGKIPFATKVAFRDHTTVTGSGYWVGSDSASPEHIQYRAGDSGSTYTTTTLWSALADGLPHTLTMTKNTTAVALYLDGALIHSANTAGSTALISPWHFGRNGSGSVYYAETLSEFAVVSRAVTATEARDIHGAASADGLLHITHADVGSTKASEIKVTPQGALRPLLVPGSVTATGFSIKFLDNSDVQVTVADADMALSVSRDVQNVEIDPTHLTVPVFVAKQDTWAVGVQATLPTLFARLGEPSGTSFNDEIGGNDGTLQATVTLGVAGAISGDADTAVTLDGAQGKIAFANPGLTGPFSVSLWFKCTGVGSVGATTYGTLLGWGSGPLNRRLMYRIDNGLLYAETGGAIMQSPANAAALNVWNHFVYTWDGTTQRIIINGASVVEGVTANVALNSAMWLGSALGTSSSYSFKGGLDEFVLWDRALTLGDAQQLYVNGADAVLSVDRATEVQIAFRGLFETFAPPPSVEPDYPPPADTALPAGDEGGAATSYVSLAPYRSVLNAYKPYFGRLLPATQPARDAIALNGLSGLPNATSDNWRIHCCQMFGFDPTTGAVTAPTQGGTTPVYLNVQRHRIYVVSDTQPLRSIDDIDTSSPGWAPAFDAANMALGGVPIPADALPDSTPDRYNIVFQPGTPSWYTLYASQPAAAERSATIMELTSSPSGGGVFVEFDYLDNVNQNIQTFFAQSPVLYNDTAVQIRDKLTAAKTTTGAALGTSRSGAAPIIASGGPLNVAPVRLEWTLGAPLRAVGMRSSNNFLNAGSIAFTYEKADAWGVTRLGAITHPSLAGGHQPPAGVATATKIDNLPMVIDWAEYNTAYNIGIADGWDAAGTDLGQTIGMVIGNAGTGFVYPALSGDGTLTNTDGSKVKEGALGTFPVGADFSKVAPEMMPIFNTIKRYGFFVYDKTGGGAEFVFHNWAWPGLTRPFPGPSTFKFGSANYIAYMRQLPWHQLQFIDPVAVQAGW